ncbi:putative development/cell death domain, kelch-type beta propeller containing protein [Tanacetum coccineum]
MISNSSRVAYIAPATTINPVISNSSSEVIAANTWEDDSSPQGYDDKGNLRQELKTSGGFMEENNWDGKWDQPWESDEDPQVNTTTDDFPLNQDYKANGMEENKWGGEWEQPWGSDLIDEVKSLKGSQLKQIVKINMLEKRLVESKQKVQQLKNRICSLEHGSQHDVDPVEVDDHESIKSQSNFDESVYIKYASAAILNGELYHFGGEGFHTVESFIPSQNQWVPRPPLFWKNIHVAGASVKDIFFVVGGAKGRQCSSEVEYLDLDIGKWIPTCPMQSKRLAPAMAELNNALYVSGGYDGASYISSFERHDPREEAWEKLPSMKTKKGCHSMVILNEKLYTLGGFDGEKYVPAVECFDTRMGSWVEAEPMNISRGNFGAFVLDEKLYTIGGVKENEVVMDIVECFKEGSCWEIVDLKAIGKRSHFSAIVA